MEEKIRGKVKWFSTTLNYGFVTGSDSREYFFHVSDIQENVRIFEGDEVEFESKKTEKGFSAIRVIKV